MREFGGDWTRDKLNMLERYLDAYTTALKNRPFRLMYIDAFAGSGLISIRDRDEEAKHFIEGSALRAAKVDDRRFDELLLVEKDSAQYAELQNRVSAFEDERIQTYNRDANDFLQELDRNWNRHRGVLFLDPFATEVAWTTIEKVASFNALDTWILFPVMAVCRMLERHHMPCERHASVLTHVYGDDTWMHLYRLSEQQDLWKAATNERDKGTEGFIRIYKDRLHKLYGERFMEHSASLCNSKNGKLFEFIFCVGSPDKKAIRLAKKIARHIIEHQQRTGLSRTLQ